MKFRTPSFIRRLPGPGFRDAALIALGLVTAFCPPAHGFDGVDVAAQVGVAAAQTRLGEDTPTGRGIVVGHVEGNPGRYTCNTGGQNFVGIDFTLHAGPSVTEDHAQRVARVLYGRAGLAPGVTEVHAFPSGAWMNQSYLRTGTAAPPATTPVRVFNHSWISDPPGRAELVLFRADHVVDTHDVIMVCGVNNGRNTPVPAILASAHNVLAVGTLQGQGASSGGYTTLDTPGRCKPDLVGPRGLTSFATPAVTGIVARYLEAADAVDAEILEQIDQPLATRFAARSEAVRAVLMASAAKPRYWSAEEGRPLDEHLGAGLVHLDRALRVLEGGAQGFAPPVAEPGWALSSLTPGQSVTLEMTFDEPVSQFCLSLNWNRRVDPLQVEIEDRGNQRLWIGWPRSADLDLRLERVTERGVELVAESVSRVDNVEHLYFPTLEPGAYRVTLNRVDDGGTRPGEAWDYALAWYLDTP